ncbi:MAG: NAD-dependent epimerase/dehydratase family protein, partial [Chloroflexota bacterium]
MPKTVLITGVTGFTGRFLAERYVSLGWEVHGVHRARTADYPPAPSGMHSHRVDLMDASSVYALLASIRPDVIQHLAAQSSVSVSMSDPAGTLWVNTTM